MHAIPLGGAELISNSTSHGAASVGRSVGTFLTDTSGSEGAGRSGSRSDITQDHDLRLYPTLNISPEAGTVGQGSVGRSTIPSVWWPPHSSASCHVWQFPQTLRFHAAAWPPTHHPADAHAQAEAACRCAAPTRGGVARMQAASTQGWEFLQMKICAGGEASFN